VSLKLIRKRVAERKAAKSAEDGSADKPSDFLDLLLDARDKDTGRALTEEVLKNCRCCAVH
jgi:cytochrome P450